MQLMSNVRRRIPNMRHPSREPFAADPFGYSALAWHKWGTELTRAGFPVDPTAFPTSRDLKNPILWLSHAGALAEAATTLTRTVPAWSHMPLTARGMCDSQFCAVALMLVGYSLEVCLKAMLLMKLGEADYESREREFRHHRLEELAGFVPDIGSKDRAILQLLTHFTVWAGRYPDPGRRFEANAREIFEVSEREQISGREVFSLAARVMKHAQTVADTLPTQRASGDA